MTSQLAVVQKIWVLVISVADWLALSGELEMEHESRRRVAGSVSEMRAGNGSQVLAQQRSSCK